MKKVSGELADCSDKQNGVQEDRDSASPCSERSIDKEAQEMVAALEMRIKEETNGAEEEDDDIEEMLEEEEEDIEEETKTSQQTNGSLHEDVPGKHLYGR